MATGTGPVSSFGNWRLATTKATWASSLPAFVRTRRARSSSLAATAGNSVAKSGGGIEFAARARSTSDLTPQALQRASASDEYAPVFRVGGRSRNSAGEISDGPTSDEL